MSTITKDLGAVTAYAYAQEKGYTGTEAEYAELMASYASVAQQAGESAQTATEKAQQASASATSASQSASTASASAQTAQTAQQTATAKASEAQQSATTATTKAQEASQSASESSQSASTAVQAKEDAQTAKTASETAQASAESARDDAETARDEAQQYAESIDPEKLIGAYPVDTATGAIASFSDGADNIPMKKVTVRIEPVQDLHGQDAPYPAGGGKNLLETSFEDRTVNGITITRTQEGGIAIKGTPTRDYSFVVGTVTLLPGTYDFWGFVDPGGSGSTYQLVYTGENMQTTYIAGASSRSRTIESETVVTATVFVYGTAGAVNTLIKPMVTVSGTQVDSFAPYSNICPISGWTGAVVSHSGADMTNPTTYPITFPSEAGTIYGGELDVTNGELVVDRAYGVLNNPDRWDEVSETANFRYNVPFDSRKTYNDSYSGLTCSYVPCLYGAEPYGRWNSALGAYFCIKSSALTLEQVKADTEAGKISIVYELATPITLTLSPTEIKSLLGDNNLWADAGDSTVIYRADTTMYINRKIAEAVSALS